MFLHLLVILHLAMSSFPPSWPVYSPAQKVRHLRLTWMLAHNGRQLANWLEYYAEAMELNVWTSTSVESVRLQDDGRYEVVVKKADGTTRTFHVAHVIMALGFGGGVPNMPTFPGQVRPTLLLGHEVIHTHALFCTP